MSTLRMIKYCVPLWHRASFNEMCHMCICTKHVEFCLYMNLLQLSKQLLGCMTCVHMNRSCHVQVLKLRSRFMLTDPELYIQHQPKLLACFGNTLHIAQPWLPGIAALQGWTPLKRHAELGKKDDPMFKQIQGLLEEAATPCASTQKVIIWLCFTRH